MSSVTAVPLRPIRRHALVALWIGIAALVAAALLLAWSGTRAQVAMAQPPEQFLAKNAKRGGVVTTASGLQYKVLKPGAGAKVTTQDIVRVNYEGRLADGKVFDSSAKHGQPGVFAVGSTIAGFDEGLQLMNRGAKYRFWIPPGLGYGPSGTEDGTIPANALLVFDVELLDARPRPPAVSGAEGLGGLDQPPEEAPQR